MPQDKDEIVFVLIVLRSPEVPSPGYLKGWESQGTKRVQFSF